MINEYILAGPIISISVGILIVLMADAMTKNKKLVFGLSLLVLLITGAISAYTMSFSAEQIAGVDKTISAGMVLFGAFPAFFDILFCLGGIMTILSAREFIQKGYKEYNEFYTLILFSIIGMITIAHSNNLLMLFLGVETMSITFYVLAGFFRTKISSIEAALKYFLLGSFASGFLLYGIAMLYGATGTMNITLIAENILSGTYNPTYLSIGFGLMLVGLGFKIAAFPFHQWAPDVYTGSPTVVTGFMSTAGKAAAFAAFILIAKAILFNGATSHNNMGFNTETSKMILAVLSAATMLIGNLTALSQKSVKRMLAYSSVAHAGYMLMGIVSNTIDGYQGLMFYTASYLLMQIGAFAVVAAIENGEEGNLQISDYKGLRAKHPVLSLIMACFMLSLAGIPPFAGFIGKYLLFIATVKAGYVWLTVVAVIASIISMYFYIGLILNMYFKDTEIDIQTQKLSLTKVTLTISIAGIIVLGIFPSLLLDMIELVF